MSATQGRSRHLYIETVTGLGPEQRSLHLARHLPRRLRVGDAIIIHDRPDILLAVIRKRWMHIIKEIDKARAGTLDPVKRPQLDREIAHMRAYRFGTTLPADDKRVDALFIRPEAVPGSGLRCRTMYVAAHVDSAALHTLFEHIVTDGLAVVYEQDI